VALRPRTAAVAAGAGAGTALAAAAAARAWRSEPARFARMAGSSVAAPDAAGWVTDFLNAAYYRRRPELRELADLRLAFGIVTTRWHRAGRRLRGPDVLAFHRAFGRSRFLSTARTARGTLDGTQLRDGAARLLGGWFPDAWEDPARRGWGIAFETPAAKAAYRPEARLRHARLGAPAPLRAPGTAQTWHTYPPVELPSAHAALAALAAVERWPDYATELGRFTPVREGGLRGQTFEIEVAAGAEAGLPVFTRGYVTVSGLLTTADGEALDAYASELNAGLKRFGTDEPDALPAGAALVAALDLSAHEGHFMGASLSRLLLYEQDERAWIRAAGTWDPMPWHLKQAYDRSGRVAQRAFWGETGDPRRSLLHQIALACREPGL